MRARRRPTFPDNFLPTDWIPAFAGMTKEEDFPERLISIPLVGSRQTVRGDILPRKGGKSWKHKNPFRKSFAGVSQKRLANTGPISPKRTEGAATNTTKKSRGAQ